MFIYADETTVATESGVPLIGYGVLFSESKIPVQMVEDALSLLRLDPDRNDINTKRQDDRTLQRNFFHACEDSKNAHSHFCRAISRSLSAKIVYTYRPKDALHNASIERMFHHTLSLSALAIVERPLPVNMYIEQRDTFGEIHARKWLSAFLSDVEKSLFQYGEHPTYFPKIDVNVVDKTDPGIQALDFILWSTLRKYGPHKDETWFKRFGFSGCIHSYDQEKMFFGNLELGKNWSSPSEFLYPEQAFPIPELSSDRNNLTSAFSEIEETVRMIARMPLPINIAHLQDFASNLMDLSAPDRVVKHINNVCSFFIRVFDMLPIYDVREYSKLRRFLQLRKLASFLLDTSHIPNVRTRNLIVEWKLTEG